MKEEILNRLKKDVVLGAEGYLFELERRGYVQAGPYVPEVVLDYPNAVRELTDEFLRAGADVTVALTYYASRGKVKDIGREKDLERLNRQAVRIAKEAARKTGAFVAGNICNTWAYDPEDKSSSKTVRKMYEEQLRWAVEEGVDFVISETNDYVGEALIALEEIKKYNLPAMVTFSTVQKDKTRDGYDYVEACRILEQNGADIVGFNCSRGPTTMLPIIEKIKNNVRCFVAAQPVPYRTTFKTPTFQSLKDRDGVRAFPIALEQFLCTRFEMAEFAKRAKEIGVNYIGICCGGAPYYVRAMAEALGRKPPASSYSPALSLHPMLGARVESKNRKFISDWKGGNKNAQQNPRWRS